MNGEISKDVATALLIGINMDTALLTRGVSQKDVDAYSRLFACADIRMVNSILRNFIKIEDLNFYRQALDSLQVYKNFGFCYFKGGCSENLLGILGDFFLALDEHCAGRTQFDFHP